MTPTAETVRENEESVRAGGAARAGMGKGQIVVTVTADHSEKNDKDLRDAARAFANSLFKMGYTGAKLTIEVVAAERLRQSAGQSTKTEPAAPSGPAEIPLKGSAVFGLPDLRPQHATTKEAEAADEFGSSSVPGSEVAAPSATDLGLREPGGDTATDEIPEAVIEADAELEKHDNPKLALKPGEMTVEELKTFLSENEYTVAELDTAIDEEMGGKNRDHAVRALKQARDARVDAALAEVEG